MAICIYCKKNVANSDEHYLPACLGSFSNYEELKDKICCKCNGTFSLLDEQFCRCGPESFFRIILGIKGRKYHEKINPIYRGSAGGKRIIIEAKHPTLNCQIFCEPEKGGEDFFPARQIIVVDQNGKYHPILITDKIKNPEDLDKELDHMGLSDSKIVECWSSSDEAEWIKKLCVGKNVRSDWSEETQFDHAKRTKFAATFTVNDIYFRAVAKIAFHYFLKHFIQFSGNEKEFNGIKHYILSGGETDQWVREIKGSFIKDLQSGLTTNKYCHIIAIDKNEKNIRAMLQFFIGPKSPLDYYYEVLIGANPEKIIFPQRVGHQFVYFEKLDDCGYCGRMDPLIIVNNILVL